MRARTRDRGVMKVIVVANQKGGCGKTTTAVNTAAALAMQGMRVLLVDLDSQGHSTLGLGYEPNRMEKTVYHCLTEPHTTFHEVAIETDIRGLLLAPSNIMLGTAEIDLQSQVGRELILGEKLRMVGDDYDFCVIDCAPPMTLLMINALVAGDYVIVTVQTHYYALDGLKRLMETIQITRKRFHPCAVKTLGLVLTFVEDRTRLSRQVQKQMRAYFGALVMRSVIHRSIRLAEAPSAGQSILTYAPESKGALEYEALAREIMERIERIEDNESKRP